MSASTKACPEPAEDNRGQAVELPELKQQVHDQFIPEELLVTLTSTMCRSSTPGPAHHRHSKGCGIRRPDAIWHHPLGRKKYKYFLEQPTSLTGAGSDISFLCDAMATQRKKIHLPPLVERSCDAHTQAGCLSTVESLIPEEYHIVKNKGLQGLHFYEDKYTVQLQDEEQRLRVFPSLRPSSRVEVVQLMNMMDDMLEKAGVEQQCEELTELSQMQGLLELVRVEQNIYNIVFHELIRQVSVGCAERGQLLAKLRQRYQSLLERIPRRLKALHAETLAQRALDHRLTEEIFHLKTSMQQLNMELSKIRDHDAFVSQQSEHAQQQLAKALDQVHRNSDLVQTYHELYEMQRRRLEAQLLRLTEERDGWSQVTFSLALKVISLKKLQVVSRLHVSEQGWAKTAEHCTIFLTHKDTEKLNVITQLTDQWKDQLAAFMSQLRKTEHAQCEQISTIQKGFTKWLTFCTAQNKSPNPKYEKDTEEDIYADLKQWSNTLTLQCERYGGTELLQCKETLGELGRLQGGWVDLCLQLFSRHPARDGAPPKGHEALRELDSLVFELLKQLETRVSGESGIYRQIMSLVKWMDSWASRLKAEIDRPDNMPVSYWRKLETALCSWQSLADEALQHVSSMQTENEKDKNNSHVNSIEVEDVFRTMERFISSQSNFFDIEDQRLCEEVSSIHKAMIHWMLDLLLLMVPDHSKDQDQDQDQVQDRDQDQDLSINKISLEKLQEDAMALAQKLAYFSKYITSSCQLILEEQILKTLCRDEAENEMFECKKLQKECSDWVETCGILLFTVKGSPVELSVTQPDAASGNDVTVSPADSVESLVKMEVSSQPEVEEKVKDESQAELEDLSHTQTRESTAGCDEPQEQGILQGEPSDHESPVMKLIQYDGHITESRLEESSVQLDGTKELVVFPATDEAQDGFSALATVGLLQRELSAAEVRIQSAEQRALKAEEALQAALQKIQDLERQLQGRSSLEPKGRRTTSLP
ncbi:axonemal dynein light chain domain-containing protein 1 [Myripristis murdjan]|uniref:axonemal dynein light chain domain-containing protein 1 n=1 Tax=Myripristis murdjan TaxID=586833 RepID=UPI001176110B|nr:axonemal dynein light chain domain-containing protein 1 [Myripristis murdjan]